MTRLLVCIAQKHTKTALAQCELTFKSRDYHLSDIISRTEKKTGLKVDGYSNYIEWIEVD